MDRHGVSQLYSNVAIPPASRCIRLLEIEAAVDEAGGLDILQPLAGRLRLANLDDNPSFVSLSYVWGKGASSHYIVCQPGNCLVNIPWNCFRGLQQVTRRFCKASIWVDSICINQNDDEEKIHQIPLMRDIYSMATCVYVLLGDGNKASDRALRFLKRQARFGTRLPLAIARAQSDDEYRDALRQYKRASWQDMILRFSLSPIWTRKVDLDVILRSPWVFRCWTFQEFLLARDMIFLCGEETIIWEELANAICFRHEDSYFVRSRPINEVTFEQWWPLVTLWFNFSRSSLRSWPRQGRDQEQVKSIQEGVKILWGVSRYGPASQLHVFCNISSPFVGASLVALYWAVWKGTETGIDEPGRFGFFWLFGSLIYLSLSINLVKIWRQLVIGLDQKWARADNADGEIRARVIDGVRSALKNRDCSDHHDKSFSLHGVLDICNVTPSKPDYGRPVGETYHILMQELIAWDAQALVMILDAGKPPQLAPSWVPNWSESGPSEWLVSQYRTRTGASGPNAAYPSLPGDVSVVGNTVLRLQGKRVGTVTFSTDLLFPAEGSTSQVQPVLGRDLLVSALFRLVQFFAYVGDTTRHGLLSNDANTTIFAVLEGLIRIQGARSKQSSSGMMQFTVPLPAWEGPYDFTKEKKEFWRLTELLKAIEAVLPSLNIESEEGSRDATVQLFEQIAGWAYIGNYFLRLVKILVEQKRGLYVLSGGLAGTGPLGVSVGDEVFVLPGVPTPMVLRKLENGRGWTVVGATLVHSIMYGQLYDIRNGYEAIDLY